MKQSQCDSCNKIFSPSRLDGSKHNCGKGRKRKRRNVCEQGLGENLFKPRDIPVRELEIITVSVDEIMAIKMKDIEGLQQIEIAEKMSISQSTLARTLAQAHQKIALALINGYCIKLNNK